ncbi:MAG: GNAT family N-acetyltransferase [Alphaproteobacteria bacterium]|nr:GNAT family N-acetyltransferase [Alphaproteobacteria bacterium]
MDLLRLSGLDRASADACIRQTRLVPRITARKACPVLDLDRVRAGAGEPLSWLGRSTRAAARRTFRRLAAEGELSLRKAREPGEAREMFARLVEWHQARWRRRGAPGAFADPWTLAFHADLIAHGLPRGEVDLLQLEAGGRPQGVLYNFRSGTRVMNYQGGFRSADERDIRPGLALHVMAIADYAAEGLSVYDHLAGENALKRSLASRTEEMVWLELWRRGGLVRIEELARRARATVRARLKTVSIPR